MEIVLDKIINKMKEDDYRICLGQHTIDCLKMEHKSLFNGKLCNPCYKHKTRQYYLQYQKKTKKFMSKFDHLKLSRKEMTNLENEHNGIFDMDEDDLSYSDIEDTERQ